MVHIFNMHFWMEIKPDQVQSCGGENGDKSSDKAESGVYSGRYVQQKIMYTVTTNPWTSHH